MFFEENIKMMRKNFLAKNPSKDILKKQPSWTHSHISRAQYDDQHQLISSGKIYYACLIQANMKIFKRGTNNYGACIVYSEDPYFDENPDELALVAQEIYKYKGTDNPPPDIKHFVDMITDERVYAYNEKLPSRMTQDPFGVDKEKVVYYTTLIIHRHHIPKKRLMRSIFPIITSPANLKSCMILPSHYWTKEFTAFYSEK